MVVKVHDEEAERGSVSRAEAAISVAIDLFAEAVDEIDVPCKEIQLADTKYCQIHNYFEPCPVPRIKGFIEEHSARSLADKYLQED